ncbi:MAG TPA: cbb3-type cytochrome c oxidase subunit 3 [Devosia sp.]|jgi:cytochrome c oxidase cbb3-type subunit 4|uniref:cbb3-type cytochrome c oxidase subunit 3 n=1 Tax=Devosia sp. TaxID=1871048 RepID=UPI002DDCB05B|nr:cbb3-type cytochrome c oxidase subunit 3 [Devosia sp.]HEV2515835.1 cbb3-type cytochrome c oxidase subunit 3 [Devosia sp.]
MPFDHDTVVAFSKSFGLFYLIAMSIGVLVYACWPSNRDTFRKAASNAIEDSEDRPWK